MLEIQEKEFEKVRQRTSATQRFPLSVASRDISWNSLFSCLST